MYCYFFLQYILFAYFITLLQKSARRSLHVLTYLSSNYYLLSLKHNPSHTESVLILVDSDVVYVLAIDVYLDLQIVDGELIKWNLIAQVDCHGIIIVLENRVDD